MSQSNSKKGFRAIVSKSTPELNTFVNQITLKMNEQKKRSSSNNSMVSGHSKGPSSSSSSSSSSFGNNNASRMSVNDNNLLNSIKINYKIHEIPKDLLRFIPDSQLKLILPLVSDDDNTRDFIQRRKYSTNVDERNYFTVFEYQLNDNWIIWDYSTGYVFFTGLWKSCGNNKTDITKLIDNFPNISDTVKRVRGGFLKIQGTWLPFDVVKNLAKNFCFNIRYCLIPLFGEDFPNLCLKPNDVNFGKLIDVNAPIKTPQRQRRRSSTSQSNNVYTSNNITVPSFSSTSSSSVLKPKFIKTRRSKSDSHQAKPKLMLSSTITTSPSSKTLPILEMEEILKASKQLHDLSTNSNHNISNKSSDHVMNSQGKIRRSSFNYGGFIWSWKDDDNLKILGKDEEVFIVDEPGNESFSISPNSTNSTLYQHYQSSSSSYYDNSLNLVNTNSAIAGNMVYSPTILESQTSTTTPISESRSLIPKKFDGFETLLNAANQLKLNGGMVSTGTTISEESSSSPLTSNEIKSPKKNKMDIGGWLS